MRYRQSLCHNFQTRYRALPGRSQKPVQSSTLGYRPNPVASLSKLAGSLLRR